MGVMTLDEFFELAQLGGQIQATHDIFHIINDNDLTPEETTEMLVAYHKETLAKFKKLQLRFKSGGGRVRMDEESIEGLGDD